MLFDGIASVRAGSVANGPGVTISCLKLVYRQTMSLVVVVATKAPAKYLIYCPVWPNIVSNIRPVCSSLRANRYERSGERGAGGSKVLRALSPLFKHGTAGYLSYRSSAAQEVGHKQRQGC